MGRVAFIRKVSKWVKANIIVLESSSKAVLALIII